MEQKNKVLIKINGQEYPIVGAEPKEYLLKVGSFVDEKMEEIARSNKKLSTSMIAVLTCINITDLYFKLKDEYDRLKNECVAPLNELDKVKSDLNRALEQLKEKEEACLVLETQLEALAAYKQEHDNSEKETKQKLIEKETDLVKAEEIINDLQNKLFENQIKLIQSRKRIEELESAQQKK